MAIDTVRRFWQILTLLLVVLCAGAVSTAVAQTPPSPPPTNPSQQDATRPPGTERNQPLPDSARPVTQDPTAPPGVLRPAPQAPPGVTVTPQTPSQTPGVIPPQTPVTPPTTANPLGVTPGQDTTQATTPATQPRPVPPLPDLSRLGVTSETLSLSLKDAIRRALENNNDIEVARDDVRIAETTLRSLLGIYDPVFNLNPQISNLVQAQQNRFAGASTTGTISQTDITTNANVNKFFQTGGGQYQFFFNNDRRTTNSTANVLNPVYSGSFGVTFTQPLLRDRSIDRNRHDIRVQRKRVEQSDADFRRRTIEVIANVQRAYWDLVFALRDEDVQIANLNLTRENFRRVEAQIAVGAVAPLERAQVQTELSTRESNLLIAAQTVSNAENILKQLIIRDPLAPDWSKAIMPTDSPTFDRTPVNLSDAMNEARTNRPELARLRLQRDINDIDIKFFKNQTRPRIDIQSTFATTGLAGTPVGIGVPVTGEVPLISTDPTAINTSATAFLLNQINIVRGLLPQPLGPLSSPLVPVGVNGVPDNLQGGYLRELRNLFGFGTRNIVVGVNIQIPFRNRTAQANLAGARIAREQLDASMRSQEEAVVVDVRNAAQALETARRRVITAAEQRQAAEQQLQGEQRLYEVGRSTTFLLFQRENELASARETELRAETDYNKALADLQHATSTTLRANNVIVETPTIP